MKTYNIIYEKAINNDATQLQQLISQLTATGCVINQILSELCIINLNSETTNFSTITGVVSIEEDLPITANMHTTTYWHQLRLSKKELPLPVKPTFINKGENQIIYLVDSGVATDCLELSDAVIENRIVNLYSYNEDFSDVSGHGTGLASVIVGNNVGISPKTTIKTVKIPLNQQTTIFELLKAFNAILADHANTPDKVKVVNCSWTIPRNITLDTKITELQSVGLIVVASAGNQLESADQYSPVGLDTIIGVGASDRFDRVISWGGGAGSNWGPDVDLFAPGIEVTVSDTVGNLLESSGTSIASAAAAATIVQYIEMSPTLSAQELHQLIIESSATDVLFRNESIYGTTPNRLIVAPSFDSTLLWNPTFADTLYVKQNQLIEIPITVSNPPVVNVQYIDIVTIFNNVLKTWDWVTLEKTETSYLLKVDTNGINTGKYSLRLTGIGSNGEEYRVFYTLGIYSQTPDELENINTITYQYNNAIMNEIVTVTAQSCPPKGCPPGTYCYNGQYCKF